MLRCTRIATLAVLLAVCAAAPAAADAPQYRIAAATITQGYTYAASDIQGSASGNESATLRLVSSRWERDSSLEGKLGGAVKIHHEATQPDMTIPPCDVAFDAREIGTRLRVGWDDTRRFSRVDVGIESHYFDDHRVCGSLSPLGVLMGQNTNNPDMGRLGNGRVVDVDRDSFTVQTSGTFAGSITSLGALGGFPATDTYRWTAFVRIERR